MQASKRFIKILIGLGMACLVAIMAAPAQAGQYSIGAGPFVIPDYEGSSDYEAGLMPFGQAAFDNGMFVRLEGLMLRANLMPKSWVPWLRLGPLYNYRGSRSDVENSKVDRLKNVSDAHELGLWGGFAIEGWFAQLDYLMDTGDAHEGYTATARGGYDWKMDEAWTFGFAAHSTYASGDYMSTYFGIDGADSARSGLDTYNADGGIKDVGIGASCSWSFLQNWKLRGIADYTMLIGDADDDSPVVDEGSENQFFGAAMVIFTF
jgi:outer membrane scaffolding protein for murein synthesis (MipA/OmpV family)